jgi:hypothetical protein
MNPLIFGGISEDLTSSIRLLEFERIDSSDVLEIVGSGDFSESKSDVIDK